MNIKEIMSSPVITIREGATVGEAINLMLECRKSCLPVLDDDGRLTGMVTHTDLGVNPKIMPTAHILQTLMAPWVTPRTLEEMMKRVRNAPIKDIMRYPVITVQERSPISEVADLMLHTGISRVPVLRGDELVGIISRHDFIKLMALRLDTSFLYVG